MMKIVPQSIRVSKEAKNDFPEFFKWKLDFIMEIFLIKKDMIILFQISSL